MTTKPSDDNEVDLSYTTAELLGMIGFLAALILTFVGFGIVWCITP